MPSVILLQKVGRCPPFYFTRNRILVDVIQKITQTVEPSLEAMGYALVLVKMGDGGHRKTLTLMAERKDGKAMSFDDCTEISRMTSALLDVEDPITMAYDLEVCSPGIDRPLVKLADFSRYIGYEAKIETMIPIDGRKRFRGAIKAVEGETILLSMPESEARIGFNGIRYAKLVMTDALVAEAMKRK